MQKIRPFLWFEKEAGKAAGFYASIFENSKIKGTTIMTDTPSGTVEIVTMELLGQEFTLMAAGPLFKFTPAISFLVVCNEREEVDRIWEKLSQGGVALMPLDKYPFSERYGWIQDKYGLSWQVIFQPDGQPKIIPTLMFVGKQAGKAEDAIRLYTSVFHHSGTGNIHRYEKQDAPDKEGTIKHAGFTLEGQDFAAMDSAHDHKFNFTEAISLEVRCETQQEVDYYWAKLSAEPKSEQCGWLKDPYGVSWQVVPTMLNQLLNDKDATKRARVTQALLQMKKLDIATLQRAYEGA